MSDSIEVARELATHASDIKHLQNDMDKLVEDMEEIKKSLRDIQQTLSQAEGGWKVLLFIGGVSNLVTGLIVHYFWGKS